MHGFKLRRIQAAWRDWTRECAVAARSHAVHAVTRKAQMTAVIFLERMYVCKAVRQLQRAWGTWQQGLQSAEIDELKQVRL